ncbi:protein serine threonine phosphatase 2C [Coniophora puteana RWD-64-598 SS2]|uniref:Protein serine threonine phosphatase 2C n=1 Tax=Coniophora puteana (strain RWD-64-598) TaxID=741705 RepID=A0A5M3MVB8_CONPW|nr:protein serine threonine phosphatase 2C [Coniophora puteana RWD-64-598 SS2]EIW82990.1 protein serine threonine phosphatase 2C [Coniophora puteana RWD-64-598 SS2]
MSSAPEPLQTRFAQFGYPPDVGPWTYHALSEPKLSHELERLSFAKKIGSVSCVSCQPCPNPNEKSQDRYVVEEWPLSNGTWTLAAVFDGHGGADTAEYVVTTYPGILKGMLTTALAAGTLEPAAVSHLLANSVKGIDDSITQDLLDLFPGGEEAVLKLSDDQISAVINDHESGGKNNAKVIRCLRGTTALVSLVDPGAKNLWVASLGDCQAVLGTKSSSGQLDASLLSANHNGAEKSEVDRIRSEHPGEEEVVLRDRVLGAIAVTRAIGDHLFKLPRVYTQRIFENCKPGFRLSTPLPDFLGRNKTPPYLSAVPDVQHVALSADSVQRFLMLCSDGLTDLYRYSVNQQISTLQQVADRVVEQLTSEKASGADNKALALLRDAFGGDDDDCVSQLLTVEMTSRWIDDTTILILPL